MKNSIFILTLLAMVALSCNPKNEKENISEINNSTEATIPLSKADSIVNAAIEAHGGDLYKKADYTFSFRDKKYHFKNNDSEYEYSSEMMKGDSMIKDVKINNDFTRFVNGKKLDLNAEDSGKYGESLNSVIYFATLPYKLQDASVNKKYIEETTIKGKKHDVIEVTFGKDGGGKDFDDEYQYWINKETHKIDYLAYSYHVNEGGVRFRVAYNSRVVDGITFQDYENYEAAINTPLKDLAALYEKGKLKEVSKIVTENVVKKKTNTD
ncbi:DUF6503 family protein [Frigoriflavimonas asaccharolytica]|uniref:Deoxyribose-phosphate aldolase n=1 Tax=Frigoriflavimonas asaccharolytica TaxID=2735899 RepID=A0A8J8G6I1_9FLAO|nr:DUF6503 family protein [Frigoriflavimonas asaccharolytica]NRS91610.1 hypothetical protein [Frigoriflavimonas asaccharolytica]